MLEVQIQLRAERTTLLLPTVLVGSSSHSLDDTETVKNSVSLAVPDIQLHLRLHDYYMGVLWDYIMFDTKVDPFSEMSLNFDRITASVYHDEEEPFTPQTPHEILMIDGHKLIF